MPLCDYWQFVDNTDTLKKIATGSKKVPKSIYNAEIWQQISEYAFKK